MFIQLQELDRVHVQLPRPGPNEMAMIAAHSTGEALSSYNFQVSLDGLTAFSGRGEIPHRRYLRDFSAARERPAKAQA